MRLILSFKQAFQKSWLTAFFIYAAIQIILWIFFLTGSKYQRGNISVYSIAQLANNTLLYTITAIYIMRKASSFGKSLALSLLTVFSTIANFSFIYWTIGTSQNWNIGLSHLDAVNIAFGIFSTAGLSGIYPTSELARGVITTQMIYDLPITFVVIGLLVTQLAKQARIIKR